MVPRSFDFEIRPIEVADNTAIESIVISTLHEHGAIGTGFASSDPELSDMYNAYQSAKTIFLVLLYRGKVVGGSGIGPLVNSSGNWCELQKMYLLPEARGFGMGRRLIEKCITEARKLGYKKCYLETLHNMEIAQSLYSKVGFILVEKRRGGTGHSGCPVFMEMTL